MDAAYTRTFTVDIKGLAIECLSLHPLFPGKVGGSILKAAGLFSRLSAVNENPFVFKMEG